MNILVTGAAGFIGFHVAKRLLGENHQITGIDNLNDYYDPALKAARLKLLQENPRFNYIHLDIADRGRIDQLFKTGKFDMVLHFAAQAGVRYSMQNPYVYVESNVNGFMNIIEACRQNPVKHLMYASSSSVYGANTEMPFSLSQNTDRPLSLYAATKKANELMAYTYAHLYQIPMTGMRFFTVYGPWGRPDMALFMFTEKILNGDTIEVFNNGNMKRDFTYIDDAVESVCRLMNKPPQAPQGEPPFRTVNIGSHKSVPLGHFIEAIEKATGKKAHKKSQAHIPADLLETLADITELEKVTGFKPSTPIEQGVARFVEWYRAYYSK